MRHPVLGGPLPSDALWRSRAPKASCLVGSRSPWASPRMAVVGGRRSRCALVALAALAVGLVTSGVAQAAPGQALRLGGIEQQGPASRAVTALHHNPAML